MSHAANGVGAVVLNWNEAAETLACLEGLTAAPGGPAAVWVVDNGSAGDEAARIARRFPRVTVLASPANRGFAGGTNLGLRAALDAGHELLLLLNNDARLDGDDLALLATRLAEQPRLGIVGPAIRDGDDPERLLAAGGRDVGLHLDTRERRLPERLAEVAYVPGTCALVRRQVFETAGLLDERFFFAGEMADLCARARRAGWASAVEPAASALHFRRPAAAERRALYLYYVLRNRFLYVRLHHAARRWRLVGLWTRRCARTWLEAARARDGERARAARLACADGWRGRWGNQNARLTRGRLG